MVPSHRNELAGIGYRVEGNVSCMLAQCIVPNVMLDWGRKHGCTVRADATHESFVLLLLSINITNHLHIPLN